MSPLTTDTSPIYSRRVSFNERLYLAADKHEPGFCVQYVIEGVGSISYTDLQLAVEKASIVNPGSRLILRGFLGWMRWLAYGPIPPVRILTNWTTEEPPPELQRPLPPKTGPTCEVIWAPGEISRIVFRCFHGVMDGRGLFIFAEDVFRALRNEPLLGALSTLNDTEFATIMAGKQTRKRIKMNCRSPLPPSTSYSSDISTKRFRFNNKKNIGVVAKLAAGLAKFAGRQNKTPSRIMIPVDVRNYKRDVHSTGNLTYPLFLELKAGEDWQDVHKKILKGLAAKEIFKQDPFEKLFLWLPLPLVSLNLSIMAMYQRFKKRFLYSAIITHMDLSGSALSGGGFVCTNVFFVPPQSQFVSLGISSVLVDDKTNIVIFGPEYALDPKQLDMLGSIIITSLS